MDKNVLVDSESVVNYDVISILLQDVLSILLYLNLACVVFSYWMYADMQVS